MYEQQIIDTEKLKLPHPGMALRSFVLKPLMDLNPELMTPLNQTVRELFSRIDCSDLKLKSNDLQ
jgi:7,8-dihydro-6-hydroxymethylpterin-pyrophosphokinase